MRFMHEVAFSKGFRALTKYKDAQRKAEQLSSPQCRTQCAVSLKKTNYSQIKVRIKKGGSCFLLRFSFLDIFLRGDFQGAWVVFLHDGSDEITRTPLCFESCASAASIGRLTDSPDGIGVGVFFFPPM